MIAETFIQLITDPAHWGQEFVAEAAFFGIEILILDRLLHREHPVIRPKHGRREDHGRRARWWRP